MKTQGITTEEIEAIVLAEYAYWKDVPGTVGISAVGACANIYAAIAVGHRAPWHPPKKVEPKTSAFEGSIPCRPNTPLFPQEDLKSVLLEPGPKPLHPEYVPDFVKCEQKDGTNL